MNLSYIKTEKSKIVKTMETKLIKFQIFHTTSFGIGMEEVHAKSFEGVLKKASTFALKSWFEIVNTSNEEMLTIEEYKNRQLIIADNLQFNNKP